MNGRSLIGLALAALSAFFACGNMPASGLVLSDRAVDMIIRYETGGKAYYVKKLVRPTWPGGDSGVTIGIGYDLGYYSAAQIRSDWASLPEKDLRLLCTVAGLKRQTARASVSRVRSVTVPWELALDVYRKKTIPAYASTTKTAFQGLALTHPHVQGAMVSLVYNRGASMSGASRKEMRDCRDDIKSGQVRRVPAHIRSMKRLWIGKGLNGLLIRREEEACLVELGLKEKN